MTDEEFVRDYLSPMVAAAKDNSFAKWKLEFLKGSEVKRMYGPPEFEHIMCCDDYVVATVRTIPPSTLSNADYVSEYRYYINVTMDSRSAIAYDVMKVLICK